MFQKPFLNIRNNRESAIYKSVKFAGIDHCDQIWQNFATLAKLFKFLAII